MIKAIRSAISFLTTLPLGGDVEELRKNLWLFPYAAILIALIVSVPHFIRNFVDIRFLALVLYLGAEGINHVDGLADFGDALFAPKNRKREAIKDLNTGAGGVAVVVVYFLLLYTLLYRSDFWEIALSQVLAKYSMLLLMLLSRPSWDGMGSYFMGKISSKDVFIGAVPVVLLCYKVGIESLAALASGFAVVLLLKAYSEKHFGGVNGDVIGSANCLTFAASLSALTIAGQL
jgi:adenosylcobinamide-GDP ribazoletransferase